MSLFLVAWAAALSSKCTICPVLTFCTKRHTVYFASLNISPEPSRRRRSVDSAQNQPTDAVRSACVNPPPSSMMATI